MSEEEVKGKIENNLSKCILMDGFDQGRILDEKKSKDFSITGYNSVPYYP